MFGACKLGVKQLPPGHGTVQLQAVRGTENTQYKSGGAEMNEVIVRLAIVGWLGTAATLLSAIAILLRAIFSEFKREKKRLATIPNDYRQFS